jgi:hypothetical protein
MNECIYTTFDKGATHRFIILSIKYFSFLILITLLLVVVVVKIKMIVNVILSCKTNILF